MLKEPDWTKTNREFIDFLLNRNSIINTTYTGTSDIQSYATSSSSSSTGPRPLNDDSRKQIKESYEKMANTKKIKIGDRYLEDVVFEIGKKISIENMIHSWIVDLDDTNYTHYFNSEQIMEIARKNLQNIPSISAALAEEMRQTKEEDDNLKDFVVQKIGEFEISDERYLFYLGLLNIMTVVQSNTLSAKSSEMDIMIHLWSHIVDLQFLGNKFFKFHRGEITGLALAKRKQQLQKQEVKGRKPMGRRSDVLIRSGTTEFAYGEASLNDPKNEYDSKIKTCKAMKDMLSSQFELANFDQAVNE